MNATLEGSGHLWAIRLPGQAVTTQNRAQGDVLGVGGAFISRSRLAPATGRRS